MPPANDEPARKLFNAGTPTRDIVRTLEKSILSLCRSFPAQQSDLLTANTILKLEKRLPLIFEEVSFLLRC